MKWFTVLNDQSQVIGTVGAIDGDVAWAFAKRVNPAAARLRSE